MSELDELGEPDDKNVVISSLVIETMPNALEDVAAALAAIPGVEVHEKLAAIAGDANRSAGKVVVTIEQPTVEESQATANGFIGIDGVIGVNLIYANFEDDPQIVAQREEHRAQSQAS